MLAAQQAGSLTTSLHRPTSSRSEARGKTKALSLPRAFVLSLVILLACTPSALAAMPAVRLEKTV